MGSNPGVGEARSRVTGGALALGAAGGRGLLDLEQACRLPARVSSSGVRPPAARPRARGEEEVEGGLTSQVSICLGIGLAGWGAGTARRGPTWQRRGRGDSGRVGSCACCGLWEKEKKRRERKRKEGEAKRFAPCSAAIKSSRWLIPFGPQTDRTEEEDSTATHGDWIGNPAGSVVRLVEYRWAGLVDKPLSHRCAGQRSS